MDIILGDVSTVGPPPFINPHPLRPMIGVSGVPPSRDVWVACLGSAACEGVLQYWLVSWGEGGGGGGGAGGGRLPGAAS